MKRQILVAILLALVVSPGLSNAQGGKGIEVISSEMDSAGTPIWSFPIWDTVGKCL